MSELFGKFFGKDKQQGKGRDKSPAAVSGAASPTSAQGDPAASSAAEFCT